MPKKYIFVNGVMQLNPEYDHQGAGGKKNDPKQCQESLAVVSTPADVAEMKQVHDEQEENQAEVFCVHANVTAAQTIMEEEEYVGSFAGSNGDSLFNKLLEYFEIYEVPIGLLYKLLELRNFKIHFLIDDSGSMLSESDAPWDEATPYIPRNGATGNMTRIIEEENRLHIFIDILAYIPTKGIRLMFMNTNLDITLLQFGRSPDEFKAEAHASIRNAFAHLNYGMTPTYKLLSKSFADATSSGIPTHHYLLTDGVPSDKSADQVGRLIQNRANPKTNPVTLISCTNVDSECEWMKDIEEYAPYTSECDDYHDEKAEVLKDQGPALPYTRGFWLMCGLVAAMNPDDLDAMDESVPFTRFTLNELLGRTHSAAEYQFYFQRNPHGNRHVHLYDRFLNEQGPSSLIVPKTQRPQSQQRAVGNDSCCVVM